MKSLLIFFILLYNLPSFADSSILLQKRTFGGYVPESRYGWEQGLSIMQDGSLIGFERFSHSTPRIEKLLGILSSEALDALKLKMEPLKDSNGELEFPNTPPCVDAPTTNYMLYPENRIFAQQRNCKLGFLDSAQSAKQLAQILDRFERIWLLTFDTSDDMK